MNSVRLLIVWEAVEPRRGEYDTAYLDRLEQLIDWADQAGLYVIVDMHQDVYARRFGGDGAPEWAILDEGLAYSPSSEWYLNYAQPAVQRAFDNFWRNTEGIQDRYREAWRGVVQRAKHHSNVIGYDLMNEPFPGSLFLDLSRFDRQFFQPFTAALAEAIHAEDPEGIVFFEPNAMRTNVLGADGFPTAMEPPGGPGFMFAPHFYDPVVTAKTAYDGDTARLRRGVAALVTESNRLGVPLWVGEWSGVWTADYETARGGEFLEQMLALFDEYKAGWSIWNYSSIPEDFISLRDGTAGAWARRMIERPYPAASAGPIVHLSYDSPSRRFDMKVEDDGGGETVVRVPASWSPIVDAGGKSFDWSSDSARISIRSRKGDRVSLSIVNESAR
ncbi:MAG: cellulase family glycosylhydrolase [Nitrospirae bacterium]|nr:cellulase family glycosylhydrolase [Nitrospirota bacterium]